MTFTLPKLQYTYDSLEPFIDARTMELHYSKHHQTYVDKLNAAVKGTEFENMDVFNLIKNIKKVPENIRQAVINHGGGHANHSFFWTILRKNENGKPSGKLLEEIEKKWESFEKFKEEFSNSALTLFGSGWAWLVLSKGKLEIIQTKNQDSPLMDGKIPLMTIDLWEHSYYLKYQNRRVDYIQAFWNVVNWERVEENYKESL